MVLWAYFPLLRGADAQALSFAEGIMGRQGRTVDVLDMKKVPFGKKPRSKLQEISSNMVLPYR